MKKLFLISLNLLVLLPMKQQIFGQEADLNKNPISIVQINDNKISALMKKSFSSLTVNPGYVTSATGIPSYNITAFDFVNINKIEKAGESEIAYTADYLNPTTNTKVAFVVYSDNGVLSKPMLVKGSTDKSVINYYDLAENNSLTVSYNKVSKSFSSSIQGINFGTATTINFGAPIAKSSFGCGNCVSNCVADAYTNHGWASIWASIQSAFIPGTIVGITLGCIGRCCATL